MNIDLNTTWLMSTLRRWVILVPLALLLLTAGCFNPPTPPPIITNTSEPTASPTIPTPSPSSTAEATVTATNTQSTPTPTQTPVPVIRFAVIGDYGSGKQAEADVADLIKGWNPDLIITTGDNNYPSGSAETMDENVGQFYHEFIHPYTGEYGEGADTNRFFPSLGNHDWDTQSAQPYLDYFTLPGNERYFDFTWGFIHFFVLDSDSREPDGVGRSSIQAGWLEERLEASVEPWNIVYFHHAPYSSAYHGSTDWMQWPFAEWGADMVIAGHDHTYERIQRDGIIYVVNGAGGMSLYPFGIPVEGSMVRYNNDYGALLVEASPTNIMALFTNRDGETVDVFELIGQNSSNLDP